METLKNLYTRRSVRQFKDEAVPENLIHEVLRAGMSAPSCVNARDWSFVVVTDKNLLNQMADANGRPAEPLRHCSFAVLACGDLERAFKMAPDYWVIDVSIACTNMLTAAHELGLGGVWLGTWPQMDRVNKQVELFGLPETIIPHSILAFGYPLDESLEERNLYEEDRVHFNQW